MNTSPARNHTIALFGGTGATGRALIRHALARGIKVRVLVRSADSVNIRSGLVEVIEGSLTSPVYVEVCLKGCDAAICVFGPARLIWTFSVRPRPAPSSRPCRSLAYLI